MRVSRFYTEKSELRGVLRIEERECVVQLNELSEVRLCKIEGENDIMRSKELIFEVHLIIVNDKFLNLIEIYLEGIFWAIDSVKKGEV